MVSFTPQLEAEYRDKLSQMAVRSPKWQAAIDKAAHHIIANRARYERAGAPVGVPWYWIGANHWREAGGSFLGILHNGERIIGKGVKTRLRPTGRGPFSTWEEAAADALAIRNLAQVETWTPERECFEAEGYNGWGYRSNGLVSAYLWSGTNHYARGKYVSDGRLDRSFVDQQVGVIPVIQRVKSLVADQEARETVVEHSRKASVLTKVSGAAKAAGGTAATIFTLDNLGVFSGWMNIFSGIGKFAAIAGICVLGYWFLSSWLLKLMADDVKKGRYTPSGAEGKADATVAV